MARKTRTSNIEAGAAPTTPTAGQGILQSGTTTTMGGPTKKRKAAKLDQASKKRGFRIKAKKIGLTYSQCPIDRKTMHDFLVQKFRHHEAVYVAQEEHKDGNKHLHCLIECSAPFETEDPRYADYTDGEKVYHPNMLSDKGNWKHYVLKHDLDPEISCRLDNTTVQNFEKRKRDFDAWTRDRKANREKKITLIEVKLPKGWTDLDGNPEPTHDFSQKNMLLLGPREPTSLLTQGGFDKDDNLIDGWLTDQEKFRVSGDKQEYHFEGYANEPFILYDYQAPKEQHLWQITNRYRDEEIKVPGQPRYAQIAMKGPAKRRVIILMDKDLPQLNLKSELIKTRFNVYVYGPVSNFI